MLLRNIEGQDFDSLYDLVSSVYDDSRDAMFFKSKPGKDEIMSLLAIKLDAVSKKAAIDIVAIDKENGNALVGECEIVPRGGGEGAVGIILRRDYRNRSIGSLMLKESEYMAQIIGMSRFIAEVRATNASAIYFFLKNGFAAEKIEGKRIIFKFEPERKGNKAK